MKRFVEAIRLKVPVRGAQLRAPAPQVDAQALAEQLKARYEQGLHDGEKALREQLLAQRNDLLALQQGVLNALKQCLPQVRSDCEQALIELALEVARKLVDGLPISAELVEASIREALQHCEDSHELTVLLHAEDLALLQRVNASIVVATIGGEKLHFQSSPEVTRGGCLVQTRFGVLDARRETKFELLRKSLQN